MDTLSEKCMDSDAVGSFCGCIAGDKSADPAAQTFCNRAKTDKNVTNADLADLKMALMDTEEDSCCDC